MSVELSNTYLLMRRAYTVATVVQILNERNLTECMSIACTLLIMSLSFVSIACKIHNRIYLQTADVVTRMWAGGGGEAGCKPTATAGACWEGGQGGQYCQHSDSHA